MCCYAYWSRHIFGQYKIPIFRLLPFCIESTFGTFLFTLSSNFLANFQRYFAYQLLVEATPNLVNRHFLEKLNTEASFKYNTDSNLLQLFETISQTPGILNLSRVSPLAERNDVNTPSFKGFSLIFGTSQVFSSSDSMTSRRRQKWTVSLSRS